MTTNGLALSFDGSATLDEAALKTLSAVYPLAPAIFGAVELGLFDALAEAPTDLAGLAGRLAVAPRSLSQLLPLLTATGLLEFGDWGYRNSSVAATVLTTNGARSLRPFLIHQLRHFYDLFRDVAGAVRTGEPVVRRWKFFADGMAADAYAQLSQNPDEYDTFLAAMDLASSGVGLEIAGAVELQEVREFIDLGGGGGQVAREIAIASPMTRVTLVDLPEACRFAHARNEQRGLAERIRCVPADILSTLPSTIEQADLVLLSGILADFAEPEQLRIVQTALSITKPGGRLVVSETLLNPTRTGPLLPALLSVYMLVATHGGNLTGGQLESLLTRAGFIDVAVPPHGANGAGRSLVTARRPVS